MCRENSVAIVMFSVPTKEIAKYIHRAVLTAILEMERALYRKVLTTVSQTEIALYRAILKVLNTVPEKEIAKDRTDWPLVPQWR